MSIQPVEGNWIRAPKGGERVWLGLALTWCLVLTIMMPYWHMRGKQNSTGEAYKVEPMAFLERANRFTESHKVGEEAGIPIVEPDPGGDAYLVARMWSFSPILKLKKDQTYRLHLSSMDLQHGFALLPLNMNFQILPGWDHVLTITPTQSGEFSIICNEFCGIGHHLMTGRIVVVD